MKHFITKLEYYKINMVHTKYIKHDSVLKNVVANSKLSTEYTYF